MTSQAGRIKIAHVINSIGLGGVPEAAFQLLSELSPSRYERQLVVMRPLDEDDPARVGRFDRIKTLGIPVHILEASEHKLGAVTQVLAYLRAQDVDILHCHSYRPNLFARLAATLMKPEGPAIVAHYHNQYDANWDRDGTRLLDRELGRATDAVIACSAAVAHHISDCLDLRRENIDVIYNGVETARFRTHRLSHEARSSLGLPLDRPLITLVGRISEQKNQIGLITALPHILEHVPDAAVVLAGEPDQTVHIDVLKREIASRGLESAVVFAGFVTDMPALYAATDVLAAPSLWEGFGLMLVEAMAAGVPIVAANVGGIPEVVADGETAILVEPHDPRALAHAVTTLLTSASARQRMSEAGRARAGIFSWSHARDQLEGIYARVLREKAR